jgi:carbonic anhydrase/acetyltransferase-like protein (isoleucine patch superfamily)
MSTTAAFPRRRGRIRSKLRQAGLILTALLPGPLKKLVYRWGFGFRIGRGARIGVAYLDCEELLLEEHAQIAHGAVFWGCGQVRLGKHARVGPLNLFRGGRRIELDDYSLVQRFNMINAIQDNDCTNNPQPEFFLGYGAVVVAEHRIDITDRVRIGRRSILGGRNSSIWTHNVRTGVPVEIGEYCYIGSEIRMAPGARIPDCCVVGLGSVVVSAFEERYSLIAGVPAKRKRALTRNDWELIFGRTRKDLPEETLPPPHLAPPASDQE